MAVKLNVIVNADDFGSSKRINETIIHCHKNGILTSTSIIAKAESFYEAIQLTKHHLNLGIGIHLTLDGKNNFTKSPSSIINPNTNSFYEGIIILKKLKKFHINVKHIINEYAKQIEFVLDHNIRITHLDHHHHFHLYKSSLDAMVFVAKKYNIRYIRSERIILHKKNFFGNFLYRRLHQFYLKRKHDTIDGHFNFSSKDQDNMKMKLRMLSRKKFKAIEIIVHPKNIHDSESLMLTSKDTKNILKNCNLINYGDLY